MFFTMYKSSISLLFASHSSGVIFLEPEFAIDIADQISGKELQVSRPNGGLMAQLAADAESNQEMTGMNALEVEITHTALQMRIHAGLVERAGTCRGFLISFPKSWCEYFVRKIKLAVHGN